jgi:hypothetical protein
MASVAVAAVVSAFTSLVAVGSAATTAASSAVNTGSLVLNTATSAAITVDATFFKQYRTVLVVLVVAFVALVTGPFLRSETGFFMSAWDSFVACVFDPLWQVVNKSVLFHTVVAYINVIPSWNNFFGFAVSRGTIAYDAIVVSLDCFLDASRGNQNFQILFGLPLQLWLLLGPLPFGFVSAPRRIRLEPVTPGEYGYHYPITNQFPTSVRRFEFDETFQAQGPAEAPPAGYPNPAYTVRDLWITLSRFWQQAGDLLLGVFQDLAFPTSRLVPSFYISVTRKDSIWRKIADLSSTLAEFFLLVSIWPYENFVTQPGPHTGIQPFRDQAFGYIVPFFRNIGDALRFVSLVLNDALTLNRAQGQNPANCVPLPGTAQGNIERFLRGFPIVDFFVTPLAEKNLNIFRSNLVFCEFMSAVQIPSCAGIATNALSFTTGPPLELCPEWNGASIPLPEERINYIGELVNVFVGLTNTFANQAKDPALATQLDAVGNVVTLWLNFFIDSLIFTVNAIAFPVPCSLGNTLAEWFGVRLPDAAIATLELAYSDTCAAAIVTPASRRNIFLCFVALSSRSAPQSFWGGFCNLIDGISFFSGSLNLNCGTRKRSAELGSVPRELSLTWSQWYSLYAPYYAFETRSAIHAFDTCFLAANTSYMVAPRCNTTCAARPCVDAALDCVQSRLIATGDAANGWVARLAADSYWRTAARASLMVSDTWFGCEDGDSEVIYRTVNATVSVVRDLVARTSAAALVFGMAHKRCSELADGRNSTTYLHCIKLEPLADTWRETMEANNITRSTLCGAMLYEYGVDLTLTDATYVGCLTMLAYGSTARASGSVSSEVPLSEFLNGWTMPHAVSRSTETLRDIDPWNSHPRNTSWWGALMIDGPVAPQQARANVLADDRVARKVHDASSLAYAYFNYLADTYEHIITAPTEGHVKDAMQDALFRDRVAAVGIAIEKQTASVVASRREFSQRASAVPQTKPGTMEIARLYGESLAWVDRLYYDTVNSASQVIVERSGFDDVVGSGEREDLLAIGDGSLIEMRLEPQLFAGGMIVMPTKLALRAPHHWSSTVVLADYYQSHRRNISASPMLLPEDAFSRVELMSVVESLESFCKTGVAKRNASDLAAAAQSAATLRKLDQQISAITLRGQTLDRMLGESAVVAARIGLRLLWTLVSRMLRVDSMSAVQAAHVVIDVITNKEVVDADGKSNLQQWLLGERGYIVGVGYVERHAYDYYMEQEALTRRIVTNGIFSPLLPEERARIGFATVAKRRMLERAAMTRREFRTTRDGIVYALPGKTAWGLYVEQQRNRLRRRVSFLHRSRFLHRNGIEDEHLHVVAPPTWVHYHAVVNASLSGNVTERRVLNEIIVTAADDNDFLYSLWDQTLASIFGIEAGVSTSRDALYDQIEENAANLFSDFVTNAEQFFDELIVSTTCVDEGDYRLGGTGVYRLGCLLFLPERLFNWYTEYPADIPVGGYPYDGIFALFVGPGYQLWPASMIEVPCANPRVPSLNGNCPAQSLDLSLFNQPFQWLDNSCLHNSCTGTSIPAEKPRCLIGAIVGCDYCPQTYKSAESQGFTSGWKVVSVWSSAWRALIRNSVEPIAVRGFWFIVVLFILTEFVGIVPGTGSLIVALALTIAVVADIFYTMTPERYAFFYLLLFALRAYGRGLAWIVYLAYVINLFPIIALGATDTLIGDFLVDAAYYLSTDVLLRYLFIFFRDYVSIFVSWIIDLETASVVIIAQLEARLTTGAPTTAEFLYATASYFSIVETFVLFIPYLLAIVAVVLIGALSAALLFNVISALFSCGVCWYSIYTSIRLCCLREKVEDQEDKIELLRSDVDSLLFRLKQE